MLVLLEAGYNCANALWIREDYTIMSVSSSPSEDVSTKNANWGTLVIVLVVVIIGVVIAVVSMKNRTAPQPAMTIVNPAANVAPTAPIPPTMPPASIVPPAGRADVPGMNPTAQGAANPAQSTAPVSPQSPSGNVGVGAPGQGTTVGGPGGMGGTPNGSSAGPSGSGGAGG